MDSDMDREGRVGQGDWPLYHNHGPKSSLGSRRPRPTDLEFDEDGKDGSEMRVPGDIRHEPNLVVEKMTDGNVGDAQGKNCSPGAFTFLEDSGQSEDEIRETEVSLPSTGKRSGISTGISQISDQSPPPSPDDLYSVSPARKHFRESSPASSSRSDESKASTEGTGDDERVQNGRGVGHPDEMYDSQQIEGRAAAQEEYRTRMPSLTLDTNDNEYHDEARDIATPIPFSSDSNSSVTPNTPLLNGNLTPPTRAIRDRQSPRSTPPATTPVRRSFGSSYQSPHVSFNRERLRYSWQSIQEDEPNRPRIHIVKLVSNTTSASAGFPGGEALQFSISPGGRRIAAYNSARLYILQSAALPVGISQDYALKRRPHAVEVADDGNALAILADEHTINIYDLRHQKLERIRTIKLDFPTSCIALAPTGGLVAAAYEGGIEIFSLAPSALPTDRRAVRSQRMDSMAFSDDSSTLLGTTTRINAGSTVVVTVPIFPAAENGLPTHEELKEAWCADLLQPENIRNSSHATFMREDRSTNSERLLAWNGLADTFGILNVADLQYGNVDFPVVISPPLSTCGGLGAAIHSCPSIDENGCTVAMIVNDRTIRLYIVPPETDDDSTTIEAHSIDHELDEGYGCPFSEVRWVHSSSSLPAPCNVTQVQGRLIVASPGGVQEQTTGMGLNMGEESIDEIEGGRIIIFDFDPQFIGQPGQTFSLTLGRPTPQTLEEAEVDVAEEVALVRRRTVNQKKGGGLIHGPVQIGRAASTFGGRDRRNRTAMLSNYTAQNEATRSLPDLVEGNEALDAFEEPYQPNAPRSQASLHRAATNAQRHRFQTLEERNQEQISVESNGNFLPLPEYTEEPNAPLPSRYRAMAGLDQPAPPPMNAKIVTNTNGDQATSPARTTPYTAPLDVTQTYSLDSAFSTTNESPAASPVGASLLYHSYLAQQQQEAVASELLRTRNHATSASSNGSSPTSPSRPRRTDTFESLGPLPRSLQRTYGNAPSAGGPPRSSGAESQSGRSLAASQTHQTSSGNRNQATNGLRRAPSSASSATSTVTPTSTSARMFPPHIQSFRNATASSPSLLHRNKDSNYVSHLHPSSNAGSAAHPVTGWHPPGPSSYGYQASVSGAQRPHSRKSSLTNRSAFARTDKARKLGFFRGKTVGRQKAASKDPFAPDFVEGGWKNGDDDDDGADSLMETRTMFTTLTRGEGKCTLM